MVVGIGRGICSVVHTSDYLVASQFPITLVVSMGRRNTKLEPALH